MLMTSIHKTISTCSAFASVVILTIASSVIATSPKYAFAYDQRIALLIGLGRYEHGVNKGLFRDLPVAANDLEAVGKALENIGFNQIEIYSDLTPPYGSRFEYRSLLSASERPSSPINSLQVERLINSILSAVEQKAGKNLLLIYFTGHGGIFGKAERVLAVPDSETNNPRSFSRVQEIINNMAEKAAATDKMLVVDACADELISKGEVRVTKTAEEPCSEVCS